MELQAQALIDTGTPRELLGVVETPGKVGIKGFLPQGLCPVLSGTGKRIPEAIPDFVLCKESAKSQKPHQEMPPVSAW